MQRRVFLLFVLFIVLAGFYSSVTRERMPEIQSKQKAQTDQFNQLDEQVISQAKNTDSSSGN